MRLPGGSEFIVIGENIHTTRSLRRKGARIVSDGDSEAVRYSGLDDEAALLPIPESEKTTQDFRQGQVKHVKIAIEAAMAEVDELAPRAMHYLETLIRRQERAGADFLDLNVDEISVKPEVQQAAMAWLVRTVQGLSEVPVSIDSSAIEVIEAGFAACDSSRALPLLNSASLERVDVLALARDNHSPIVVTSAGEKGMPDGAAERIENAARMVDIALEQGFALSDIYIDPLFFPVSVDTIYGQHSLDAIRGLRERFGPQVHITGGFSNVSFGIPNRKLINDVFTLLALEAGADSGIVDPVASPPGDIAAMDRTGESYQLAEDVLLGRDEHCRAYIRAWRQAARAKGARR